MYYRETIEFYAGEKKYIDILVVPKNQNDTVVINSAVYELLKEEEVVETNDCKTDGAHIEILLGIDIEDVYTLKVTVIIGAETFIQKSTIVVRR